MPKLQSSRLRGQAFSVGVMGKTPVAFDNYGNTAVVAAFEAFSAVTAAMNELDDGRNATEVAVLSQPAAGRVIARSDGRLSYDMRDEHTLDDQTFTYLRDGQVITANVSMTENMRPAGPPKGDYYFIEVDADQNPVIYPAEDAIVRHISPDGLSEADIFARHSGTSTDFGKSMSAADLMNTIARDTTKAEITGTYYGETEALAIDEDLATFLYRFQVEKFPFRQWYLRYERGGTYQRTAQVSNAIGQSRLHPTVVTTYGSGPAPVFTNALFSKGGGDNAANIAIIGPFTYGDRVSAHNIQNLYVDNITNDRTLFGDSGKYPLTSGGIDFLNYRVTARRYKTQDVWHQKDPSPMGNVWSNTNGDRVSGAYMDDTLFGLYERFYCDTTGWEPGYYPDRRREGPKSPEDASHGIYTQGDIIDITMRHMMMFDPCFSGIQMRSGGYMHDVVIIGANMGLTIGNGESPGANLDPGSTDGNLGNPPVINGEQRRATHMSALSDFVITEAAERDQEKGTAILAGGLDNQNHRTPVFRGVVINGGQQGTAITDLDQPVGPVGRVGIRSETFSFKLDNVSGPASDPSWYGEPDIFSYNWSPGYFGGSDTTGMDTAVLDALSTGGFNDLWKSTSGSAKADLQTSLRAEIAPWEQIPALLEYYQTAPGKWRAPRTAGTTVTFLPKAGGGTFGIRADVRDDWSTTDLPGTVPGDSVDIGDFDVVWNISPEKDLVDVAVGAEGRLEITGGHLNFTGDMDARGPVVLRGGARLRGNSFTGQRARIVVNDGLFQNTGFCAGNVDLKIVCDSRAILTGPAGSMSFAEGDTLTIGGYAVAGADGTGGGAGSIAFATGSKLRFQAGVRLMCDSKGQQAGPLSTITGSVSGCTAKVEDFYRLQRSPSTLLYKAYDLTGTFQNELLTGDRVRSMGAVLNGNDTSDCGIVTSTEVAFGQLRKFRSGVNGFAATDMTLNVTLGGTLEIDLAGHTGTLTHKVIEADSLSGSFDTISVLNLGPDRDATVTIGAASITLEVQANGTGRVRVDTV